ncbi:hypothetical protein AAFF_G00368130 [Aldrovandia affinis]|uniref:Uncharacterized protein n=1 Tax=Aldrovandia affinis TaxID=143900 RepID=A0AAD7SGW2_9TELE|nr:hypothetical protein AAFF_G00368130 [Aldrovandia affinis]
MAVSGPVWMYFVALSALTVIALTLDSRVEHGENDGLLAEKSTKMDIVSGCMLRCTAQTYGRLLDRTDTPTVRFHPATASGLGEYCWSTQMKSASSERLQNSYIVLPVDKASTSEAPRRLQPTSPHQHDELKPHHGLTAISEDCGLRFDVTGSFATRDFASSMNRLKFCVKIIPQLDRDLRCPPFLVTIWLRQHPSPNP